MPIYEFKCKKCGNIFESLCFRNTGKIRAPALPAAVRKAKSSYPHFHLFLPVRVWEAVRPQHRAHHTAVFREVDLCSRALY